MDPFDVVTGRDYLVSQSGSVTILWRVLILGSNIVITIVFLSSSYPLDSIVIYIVTCQLA